MPVRLRITLLFSLLVFIILGMLCLSAYFFFLKSRNETIQTRLKNRAITTGKLLSQKEYFAIDQVRRIDSFTTIALNKKIVQAYDYQNNLFYNYEDDTNEAFRVPVAALDEARINTSYFFIHQGKEAVAYHHADNNGRIVVVAAGEDREGHLALNELRQILILSFLTGNLIVLAAGYFFSRSLLKPVQKITHDVADISAHNLVRRLQTGTTRDEWYNLAATLNELLNRLQESFNMQRRFISNASHELSTPLTSISSQLEVALQRQRSAAEYRSVIQSAYQDVQHMSKLTITLLEFAKASGDAGGLELTSVRMDEVLLEMPAQLARLNAAYTATISFDNLPDDDIGLMVYGNPTLLHTAIRNIAVNACKYSPDRTANMRLRVSSETIAISIADNGPGIPTNELEQIFQPFYRSDEGLTQKAEGFGLGLSLAYRIVKLHKGTIEVASVRHEGTTFTILLPVANESHHS